MKNHLSNLAKIAISAGLIFILLTQLDTRAIAANLAAAHRGWALITFLLFAFSIILRAARWKVLLDSLGVFVPLRLLSRWYYIGAFFNTLLPTGFGGDVVRMMHLTQYSRQAPSAVGTVIVDRFLGILVLLALGALALPLARTEIPLWVTTFVLGLFLAAAGGFWLLRRERLVMGLKRRLLARLPPGPRVRIEKWGWVRPLYIALQGYDRRTLLKALFASLVFNIVWILVNITAGLSLGVQVSLVDYLVFVPLVSLALLAPSFGGVGVRELSYVGLFTQVGVSSETAFAMSVIIYAVTVATGFIGGALLLWQNLVHVRGLDDEPTSR